MCNFNLSKISLKLILKRFAIEPGCNPNNSAQQVAVDVRVEPVQRGRLKFSIYFCSIREFYVSFTEKT